MSNPALVLLPGLNGTGILFESLQTALGQSLDVRVVRYPQLQGHARKSLPTDRPFVLLGESLSGPIAIRLAAERPRELVGLTVTP